MLTVRKGSRWALLRDQFALAGRGLSGYFDIH